MKRRKTPEATIPPTMWRLVIMLDVLPYVATPINRKAIIWSKGGMVKIQTYYSRFVNFIRNMTMESNQS